MSVIMGTGERKRKCGMYFIQEKRSVLWISCSCLIFTPQYTVVMVYRPSLYSKVNVKEEYSGGLFACVSPALTHLLSCIILNSAGLHIFAAASPQCSVGCVVNLHKCSLISLCVGMASTCLRGCYCYRKTSPAVLITADIPLHCPGTSLVKVGMCLAACVDCFLWEVKDCVFLSFGCWFLQVLATSQKFKYVVVFVILLADFRILQYDCKDKVSVFSSF